MTALEEPLLRWYDAHARDLPWRDPAATPWSVMVSEYMLQQTPVVRVLPVHGEWLARWPTPPALAAEPSGEAIRMWGRLGYPRRALRLHRAAALMVRHHGGEVPSDLDALRALPGVGDYTAAAVAVFGFGHRHPVLDTNVRRVVARWFGGVEQPTSTTPTRAERESAAALLPRNAAAAARWSVALMELGALTCTASRPRCGECPVADRCAWRAAGHPAYDGPPRRGQAWAGTDRQCRGRLLGVVRDALQPVPGHRLALAWAEAEQRERCLAGLVADGLLTRVGDGYALP